MTATDTGTTAEVEDLESFRARLRPWLKENMPPARPGGGRMMFAEMTDEQELAEMDRQRGLMRTLFDGGFSGIVIPKEYGGAGLTPAHMQVFNQEIAGYDYPSMFQVPHMTPCLAVILEFGTDEQKRRLIPPCLNGEKNFVQFLSEPSSGSDAAGAQTTAERDGDEWLINGSKIWTSGAWRADWGLLLARTNSDVPKHRGLSVFVIEAHAPGVEMHRIEMLSGGREFCQEFMTDVRIPDANRIGEVDQGWTVGVRWMFYERSFALSPLLIRPAGAGDFFGGGAEDGLVKLAQKAGTIDDPRVRDMIGEARADTLVAGFTQRRIGEGMRTGYFNDQAASISRLLSGVNGTRQSTIAFDIAGSGSAVWDPEEDKDLGSRGIGFLSRQAGQIGGGTTEMARNVISERVLGMPREWSHDKDLPFREIPKGPKNR